MRHARGLLGPSIVLSLAAALAGCMSTAFQSDLVPGRTPAPSVGTARFYITDVQASAPDEDQKLSGTTLFGTPEDLRSEALSARSDVFSDGLAAVPLALKVDCRYRASEGFSAFLSALLSVLTLCTVPALDSQRADYTVSITSPTSEGVESLGSVAFRRRDVMWLTLLSPFGLIPVPRASLIPRYCGVLDIGDPLSDAPAPKQPYVDRARKLTNAVCVEAVVKALGQGDAAKLQALYDSRKSRIQSLSLDGKPCWGWVGFGYSKPGTSSGPRDAAFLFIFTQAPTYKTLSADGAMVARRGEDGRWRPCNGYLRKTQTLTAASVLLEDGKPGRVVLRQVEEPDIDDFIDLPMVADNERAETVRWNNGVLLQVRNRSVPRLVAERSGTELLDLQTRLEKAALRLDEVRDKHNDRAQRLVEQGKGDPAPDREMAILYRQRLEVLGAILATIKQEAARKKP